MPSRTGRLGLPLPAAPVTVPARASAVAGPIAAAQPPLGRMTAEQVIAQLERYEATAANAAYGLGLCLRELSNPKRFREELGFPNFEALLVARNLPSRVTAFKLMTVVSVFSEAEVGQLGGTEKSYALIRFARAQNPRADPRRVLAPNARVLGRAVGELSAREINRGASGEQSASSPEGEAAVKASAKLGSALKSAGVEHRMRVHAHGQRCVSAHFETSEAVSFAQKVRRWRKLEKKV